MSDNDSNGGCMYNGLFSNPPDLMIHLIMSPICSVAHPRQLGVINSCKKWKCCGGSLNSLRYFESF